VGLGAWGPHVGEARAPLGECVQGRGERVAGRPAVARHAQAIGAQGIDGNESGFAGKGAVLGRRRWRMGWGGLGAGYDWLGVAALAVLVDAVAGNVLGAGKDVGA